MLIQFSVENFKSFKDEAVLSMEASVDDNLIDNVTTKGKERLLNSVGVFGANASGKSNLFNALACGVLTVRRSHLRQDTQLLETIIPYKFTKDAYAKPTSFEFIYLSKEGVKYIYGFSATQDKIHTEYLYKYMSAKRTTVFERDISAKKEFTFKSPKIKSELAPLVKFNGKNKLFLSTAALWNSSEAKTAIDWFLNHIEVHDTKMDNLLNLASKYYEEETDDLKKFTIKLLERADINIFDYDFNVEEITGEQMRRQLSNQVNPPTIIQDNVNYKNCSVMTKHIVASNDDAKHNNYELSLFEESLGTRTLFLLSPLLKKAFDNGEVVCIDEFDNSLHPLLTIFIVSLFNNPDLNKNNAQLIVSSHTLEMMSDKLLRRDQIYFVDKNNTTAKSELFSLDEYSIRHNIDRRKAYLLGRFNSIPEILDGEILWR